YPSCHLNSVQMSRVLSFKSLCNKALEQYGFQGSMSKRGDCYDNAPIESFWGILKNELVHHYNYQTREEAKADIIKYIELFYNHRRIQKGLGFKTPNQMAEDFYKLAA
ncbi:IS3 family transposase, partial [Acinetobacter baumannii]|uniref:IS3 family transposase n=1 Tax=Acinetobacter baumannii TaxID=470 RepID=UPI0021D60081